MTAEGLVGLWGGGSKTNLADVPAFLKRDNIALHISLKL